MRRDDRSLPAGSINTQKAQTERTWFTVFVYSWQNYQGACRGGRCGLQGLFTSGIIRAENKIVRQRQGAPTPHRLVQQDLCTAGLLYPFRFPMAREFSALHGTTIACAVLFCFRISFMRGDKTMKKRKQNLPRPTVHRMELWWAALPAVPGHVQRGTRPVQ